MRGDSLRDLYAKTIAVCGLGLLAGAGALVDYWPAGIELPTVGSAFGQPTFVSALPVPAGDPLAPPAIRRTVRLAVAVRRTAPLPSLSVSASPDVALGSAVILAEPPALELSPVIAHASSGEEVALTLPEDVSFAAKDVTMAMMTAPVASAGGDRNGFVAGAIKKTGVSIANAGAKTGASIMGALRTVTGAVRSINPFN